jgi:L-ascorbate metabolism protein UlaG (beta-lactamase superfamily)
MDAPRQQSSKSQASAPCYRTGTIQFIGTATVLLRYAGFTILTDPNFLHRGQHARLGYGLRSARLTDPARELRELPPLDFVVLSHLHEDHFDRVVEQELDHGLPILTTPSAAHSLQKKGFVHARPIKTWETVTYGRYDARLQITAAPGRHGPRLLSRLLPAVMGTICEFCTSAGDLLLRLYISGDTLVHEALREIPRRYPDIDIALLHLGGTRILGILVTMDAAQGVSLLKMVSPQVAIPIHYNDYTVFKSPLSEFQRAVNMAGLDARVHYLSHGDEYTIVVPEQRLTPSSHQGVSSTVLH